MPKNEKTSFFKMSDFVQGCLGIFGVFVWACETYTQSQHVYTVGLISWFPGQMLVTLLRAEPTMTSASTNTQNITMAPYKDMFGPKGGGSGGWHQAWHIYGRSLRSETPPPSVSWLVFAQPPAVVNNSRFINEFLCLTWISGPGLLAVCILSI